MGQLPYTNLGISAIKQELVTASGSMNTIRGIGSLYLPATSPPNKMSSYRGFQMPYSTIYVSMKRGGIWDGCNYWDVFSYLEGSDPLLGQYVDPNFGYVGAYWTPGGASFTSNNQRCNTCGTELTFDNGSVTQVIHGRAEITAHFIMIPQYTGFCTSIYMLTRVMDDTGTEICTNCKDPMTHDYTDIACNFICEPGMNYFVTFDVGYGTC